METKSLSFEKMEAIEGATNTGGCVVMGVLTALGAGSILVTGCGGAFFTGGVIGAAASMGCFESE